MTAASNSEARKRLADPTPHTDPTAAAVRAAQAEATGSMEAAVLQGPNAYTPEGWHALCERTLRLLATDTAAPEGVGDWHPDHPDRVAARAERDARLRAARPTPAAPVAVEGVETVETLAEVLAAHRRVGRIGCRCGYPFAASAMDDAALLAEHDAHLAARIVQARAGEGALREAVGKVIQRRLRAYDESPIGNRCLSCGHVKHNELGYCQVGNCICCDGTTVSSLSSIIRRDLRAALDPEATT